MRPAVVGVAGAALVAGVALYFVLRPTDESRVRDRIAALAALAHVTESDAQANPLIRAARVHDALAEVVDPDARVRIAELPSMGEGRDALEQAVLGAPRLVRSLDVEPAGVDVKLDDAHASALVQLTARFRARDRAGDAHDEPRAVDVRLAKKDGAWRVTTLTVWSPDDARPE